MNIDRLIEEYKETFLPKNWNWRTGQKEVIRNIIDIYLGGKHSHVVCECPTGSGKSHIAMCVSYVLNKMKHNGYILTSDISLQNQYEHDLSLCNIPWGSVKGVDRYKCTENEEVCSIGVCRMRRTNPKEMSCYPTCPYFAARDKASKSNTSVLNYSYWLVQMNECLENETVYFEKRNFVICDEAHKITDIVQSHFAPKINLDWVNKLDELLEFLVYYNKTEYEAPFNNIKAIFKAIFKIDEQSKLYTLLYGLNKELEHMVKCGEYLLERANTLYPNQTLPSEWSKGIKNASFFITLKDTLNTYLKMVDKTGVDSIIKNQTSDTDVTLNFLYTNYMVEHFFHEYVGFGIFLSATIGDVSDFCGDMMIGNGAYIKLPSSFDFSKSPIHYYNQRKMSYNMMEANTPWLVESINNIMNQNANEKGIIHSGSYDLTLKIFNGLSPENKDRILMYNGTEEKEECIRELKVSNNKVIIGPSLIEGVNLPGKHCRFLVFAKVPYLSLGDNFVKAKIALNPKWYQMKAVINMLQGVGRGVRDEKDWCTTFILDANFGDLFTRNRGAFPAEFKSRIVLHKE